MQWMEKDGKDGLENIPDYSSIRHLCFKMSTFICEVDKLEDVLTNNTWIGMIQLQLMK